MFSPLSRISIIFTMKCFNSKMNMDIMVVTICKFRLLRQYNQEWNLSISFKNITNVYMYFLISVLFSETIFGYVADLKQGLIFK